MYGKAREMKENSPKELDYSGGGDYVGGRRNIKRQQPNSLDNDDFTVSYGNYGDPHSFAPYQLILLLLDFVFNWAMDLAHEYPLAVLVTFIFQSLAIIVNLILYIMASASQAMQVGLQKRVTIHHWLNLLVSLSYITLTGWWFIWALRKSWPSVSDQFSFTWPATDLNEIEISRASSLPIPGHNSKNGTMMAKLAKNIMHEKLNSTASPSSPNQVQGHYTLWSPGFNAVYIIQRTVAILYYFIYLRATFLVLNTPAMEKFIDVKKNLVERFQEGRKWVIESDQGYDESRKRNRRKLLPSSMSFPVTSAHSIGLDEYLSGNTGFLMENEAANKKKNYSEEKTVSNRRQILWADGRNEDQDQEGLEDKASIEGKQRDLEDDDDDAVEYRSKSKGGKKNRDKREGGRHKRRRGMSPEEHPEHDHDQRASKDEDDEERTESERLSRGDRSTLKSHNQSRKKRQM